MQILALVHRVPYPPDKGEKIRAFHELDHLYRSGHTLDLLTFADTPEDARGHPELSRRCRRVEIVRKNPLASRARSPLALPRGNPLSVGYFKSYRAEYTVRRWLDDTRYDAVFCYSSPMAEYVRHLSSGHGPARIMDLVDVDSEKWKQYAQESDLPMKAVYALEAKLLADYERAIARTFDATVLVSADEAEVFRGIARDAREIVAVPNGVDSEHFGEVQRAPAPGSAPLFMFVGQMDYRPNVDAVRYFAEDILPTVQAALPEARFRIVGRAPTAEVNALASRRGVEVTGSVPDTRDHLAEATISVAPLRIARGIQNKVLEAMAARLPVVGSPQAIEGIRATAGEHAIIATNADDFAAELIALCADDERRQAVADAGRTLVDQQYAWAPAMQQLEDLIERKSRR